MTSNSSIENPSLCVYIGNTSSIDDQLLINYCSQYGTILSCSHEKRLFCDFRIIEFSNNQQLEDFLRISTHKIGSIILDVKLYKDLLDNSQLLNIDRKLFIGPILNSNNINTIVQYYKLIDPRLQHCLSKQDKQIYILIEFSNRQYIRTIIQQQTIPTTYDNQLFTIYTPVHPKELINKQIPIRNSQCQLCINGLNEKITENMLIEYFDKRASVVACRIVSGEPKYAIIEFENERFIQKLLETPVIRLHGTNLSLSKAPVLSSSTIVNTKEYNNDEIDELLETIPTTDFVRQSPSIQNEPILPMSPPIQQVNIIQQAPSSPVFHRQPIQQVNLIQQAPSSPVFHRQPIQQVNLIQQAPSSPVFHRQPIPIVTEPSPDISECGWASPPRTIINHCPPVDQPPERLSSKPSTTTMDINVDLTHQSIVIQTDIKPAKNIKTNILNFVEQFQNEIDRIKDEYMIKFTKDRTSIEHAINRLINDEQIAFDRYIYEHRRHSTKSSDNKRKYS